MSFYRSNLDLVGPSPLTNKCIVLDLDECLVHSFNQPFIQQLGIRTNPQLQSLRKRIYTLSIKDAFSPKGTGRRDKIDGIRRPHLELFLTFCFAYFKIVAVWSAGQKSYVESVVENIFRNVRPPHVVYTWEDLRHNHNGYSYDKPLQKMISEVPNLSQYMNLQNTFMMDDRAASFMDNVANGIQIPEYKPLPNLSELMADDIALLQVKRWLLQNKVAYAADIRVLDKSQIFNISLPDYPPASNFEPRRMLAQPQPINLHNELIIVV